MQLNIWTDGGMAAGGVAAGAAILEFPETGVSFKWVAHLGRTSSSNAELLAGLLGFSISAALQGSWQIQWCSDAQSVLQAVERSELGASSSLVVCVSELFKQSGASSRYTPRHKKLKLNVACDKACSWVNSHGEKFGFKWGEGLVGRNRDLNPAHAWVFLDLDQEVKLLQRKSEHQAFHLRIKSMLRFLQRLVPQYPAQEYFRVQ